MRVLSRRIQIAALALLIVFATIAAAAPSRTPASQKQRSSRFVAPLGCKPDDTCPQHVGTYYFSQLDAMLPPAAPSLFMQQVATPVISRVFATADADGTHVTHWQLRTVTVLPEPRGLVSRSASSVPGDRADSRRAAHYIVPFLFDTNAPHVYLGKKAYKFFLDNGALDGEVHLSTCNVHVPLPHADVRCVRAFGPSKLAPTNDYRKNAIGGAAAAVVLAVQAAFDVANAQGRLTPCRTGDAAACDSVFSEIADALVNHDATLQALQRHIVPKDTGSAEAIAVTVNATRAERREAMLEGIKRELAMLIDAPSSNVFDEEQVLQAFEAASRDKGRAMKAAPLPDEDDDVETQAPKATTPDAPAKQQEQKAAAAEPDDDGEF